ncbi:hypothetical protein Tco_1472761, partial [Tanacetum coccineum]
MAYRNHQNAVNGRRVKRRLLNKDTKESAYVNIGGRRQPLVGTPVVSECFQEQSLVSPLLIDNAAIRKAHGGSSSVALIASCITGAKGFDAVAFFILGSQLVPFMRLVCYKNIDSIYFCSYEKRMKGEDIYMYRNDQVGKRFAFGIADYRISRLGDL